MEANWVNTSHKNKKRTSYIYFKKTLNNNLMQTLKSLVLLFLLWN